MYIGSLFVIVFFIGGVGFGVGVGDWGFIVRVGVGLRLGFICVGI